MTEPHASDYAASPWEMTDKLIHELVVGDAFICMMDAVPGVNFCRVVAIDKFEPVVLLTCDIHSTTSYPWDVTVKAATPPDQSASVTVNEPAIPRGAYRV